MAFIVRAISSYVFGIDPSACLAGCRTRNYNTLIITKCNHIFCRACLAPSLTEKKHECPACRADLPHVINLKKHKDDFTSFEVFLKKFTYYVKNDLNKLKERLSAEKILRIAKKSDWLLKPKVAQEQDADVCAICLVLPFQMYFIVQDADPTKIGCHLHETCLKSSSVSDESTLLSIHVTELIKISKELSEPQKKPEPTWLPEATPLRVFLFLIMLPISLWALAMNARVYNNNNTFLFVLSLPMLGMIKLFALAFRGFKALFSDKQFAISKRDDL